MDMRHFSLKLFLWIFLLFVSHNILAQNLDNYPSKPLHLVVPYAPGGGLDVFNRPMSIKMSELCGQAVVIDNKAGASGVIGADYVAKAPADGYTFLSSFSSQILQIE